MGLRFRELMTMALRGAAPQQRRCRKLSRRIARARRKRDVGDELAHPAEHDSRCNRLTASGAATSLGANADQGTRTEL